MRLTSPVAMIVIGFFLSLAGVVFPLLMVIHVFEATFFLSFLSYGMSVIGLFLGIIGAVNYVQLNRH